MSHAGGNASQTENVVPDSTPDPPRSPNNNNLDHQNVNQNLADEKKSDTPLTTNENNSSKRNSSTKPPKTKEAKESKTKKKNATVINIYNKKASMTIGTSTTYVFNQSNYQETVRTSGNDCDNKERFKQMPPHIYAMCNNKLEISKTDMMLTKTFIGSNWSEVVKKLGYTQGQIDQYYDLHKHKGFGDVVYRILVDWKQSETKDATVGHLISALWSSQQYDCAEKLAATHITV